jgi:8-oxo-dGTP pyrophosphatase MutT (NUDIX family)
MTRPRPSATALLLRPGIRSVEVLLLERHRAIEFHGGDWVFPGGRVDPDDVVPGEDLWCEAAARRAAVRETLEETGLRIDPERLVPLSHWTTPEGFPKRFSTYFFVCEAPAGLAIADGVEAVSLRYYSPVAALEAHARGDIGLPPPTWISLHELSRFERVDEALESIAGSETPFLLPRPVEVPGGVVSLYPGDAAYDTLELEREGPRFRLVMCGLPFRLEKAY